MSWAKLCDTLHSHPKATAVSLEAMGLWCIALSHCGAYLTDGHVTRATALRITATTDVLDRLATSLLRAGLWELHPSGDGWQVHDYLDYNPSRAEVLAEREAKRAAGQRGAAKRWGDRDGSSHGTSNGVSHAAATPLPSEVPCPRPDPEPDPDPVPKPVETGREHERTPTASPPERSKARERAVRGGTGEQRKRATKAKGSAGHQLPPEAQRNGSAEAGQGPNAITPTALPRTTVRAGDEDGPLPPALARAVRAAPELAGTTSHAEYVRRERERDAPRPVGDLRGRCARHVFGEEGRCIHCEWPRTQEAERA